VKVLATYNIKGGVGKTATAVNLAHMAAGQGAKTLVWDLDPQGAATWYFRSTAKVYGGGRAALRGTSELRELVQSTEYPNLDILPADFSYRNLDLVLDERKKPTRRLAKLVGTLDGAYDYLFLDCPPSISLVSENVFGAADALLVPLVPTPLSERTLDQLSCFLDRPRWRRTTLLPFFSMVDRRKRLHRDLVDDLSRRWPAMLQAQVASAVDVERMGVHRAPVAVFAARSRSYAAFGALWQEVEARLS
jgi:chromosome partitioning protein